MVWKFRHKTQDTRYKKNLYYSVFKWLIIIASYAFLFYKLYQFDNYGELQNLFLYSNLHWLIFVLILLPINWLLEFEKWRYLCAPFEKISLLTSLKSVLSGLTTGFFSPNRIGELVGRPMFLKPENRLAAVLMTILNGFSQTIVIVACGIPSAVFFFFYFLRENSSEYRLYTWICIVWFALFLLTYILLPKIARWISKKKFFEKIHKYLNLISGISAKRLLVLLIYSLVRYVVFCLQYYFILFFCGVEIPPFEAAIAITLNYLLITITPSFSFSEAAVRVSFAVFFFGFFSDNMIGIASAGLLLWIINFALPMLVGSVFFAKSKI